MALLVGAVPSVASARPPVPRRYNNRGVLWVAWYAHGDGATGGHLDRNDILAMPTVGAGSSQREDFPAHYRPPVPRHAYSHPRYSSSHFFLRASPFLPIAFFYS